MSAKSFSDIPKAYDPSQVEDKWYEYWIENNIFNSDIDETKKPYTIAIPPPNITGMLTMGHILNNSLQDIFRLYNSGLKHFCFTYIGVAQMMAEFKAKCIISNRINLRYFRYDALGDKIQFMKHNIYEIYEADFERAWLRFQGSSNLRRTPFRRDYHVLSA